MSGGGGDSYPPNPNHIIQYAAYVQSWHSTWLADVDSYVDSAMANNPYTSAAAYDPDTDIDGMLAALNAFCNAILSFHDSELDITAVSTAFANAKLVTSFVPAIQLATNVSAVKSMLDNTLLDSAAVSAAVSAYGAMVHADVESRALPTFEAGMRDINAVMSSAFVIGEALIAAEEARNVAKFTSDLQLAQWSDRNKILANMSITLLDAQFKVMQANMQLAEMLGKFFIQGVEYKRALTQALVDALRMKIVAKKEETDENLRIQAARRKWNLELTQYAASMLGSAGGGHAVPQGTGERSGSTVSSVLGGVMAGASIGAMFNDTIGGQWGSIGGGILGGVAGLLG